MQQLPTTLNSFVEKEDLLRELLPVAVQLCNNDLASAGIDAALIETTDVFQFRDELNMIISKYGVTSETTMRLLYRVDVPQLKTEQTFSSSAPSLALTEQIVIRELQKAWTRKYFS